MTGQGFIKTIDGAKIYAYRAITPNNQLSNVEYLPESKFKIGVNNDLPVIQDTDLKLPVPILTGTVNDNGSNELTGADGGENSTSNTITFKPGAGQPDNTAQNLNVNDTNDSKRWFISDLSNEGETIDITKMCGLWLFFRDDVLDKINNIFIKIGTDSSNYYYKEIDPNNLVNSWNWVYLGFINELLIEGLPTTPINYFEIEILTEEITDTWSEGQVIYDLLRTFTYNDTVKDFVSDFPTVNFNNLEVTKRSYLTTIDAVGFNINGYGEVNADTQPKLGTEATISTRGKADTDEIIFTTKERIIL